MSRRGWVAAATAGLLSVVAEPLSGAHPHLPYAWHQMPGFDLLFGFAGCVAIVVLSKALGRAGVQRPEPPGDEDAP